MTKSIVEEDHTTNHTPCTYVPTCY